MEKTNYKELLNKVIDLGLTNCLSFSNMYINFLERKLELLQEREEYLLSHKPCFLFKKSYKEWENDLKEIACDRLKTYENINEEVEFIRETKSDINT